MSIVCYVVYGGQEIDGRGWQQAQHELATRGFDVEIVVDDSRHLDLVARNQHFGGVFVHLETRESNGALELSAWPEHAAAELGARPHSLFLQVTGEGDAVLDLFAACAGVLAEQLDGLVYDQSSATLTRADGSDANVARIVLPRDGIELANVGLGTALVEWPHDLAPAEIERTVQAVSSRIRLLRIGKFDHLDPGFARERTRTSWQYVDLGDPDATKLSLELELRQRKLEIRIVVDDAREEPAIELARAVLDRLATTHAARLVGFEPD